MASSRMLGSWLGAGGRAARCSPARHATTSVHAVYGAAFNFTSAVNNGDAAPVTGSEEDRERKTSAATGDGPASRTAAKAAAAADVGGKEARGTAEEVKEAGRDVKDRAKEVGEDVKESVKETR